MGIIGTNYLSFRLTLNTQTQISVLVILNDEDLNCQRTRVLIWCYKLLKKKKMLIFQFYVHVNLSVKTRETVEERNG